MILRLLNVATPLLSVIAVSVPASAGLFCTPDGVGEVASAAVTVTPTAALPLLSSVTVGCVPSTAPTCPPDGCLETVLDEGANEMTSWPSPLFVYMANVLLNPAPVLAPVPVHWDVVVAEANPFAMNELPRPPSPPSFPPLMFDPAPPPA